MRAALAGFIVSVLAFDIAAATPLAAYTGSKRVLVISAPTSDDPAFREQVEIARGATSGMTERDLVIVQAVGAVARDDRGSALDATGLRAALSLPAHRFEAVLIGKDGGAKLRSEKPISIRTLFGTVDAMPMRQDEMRRAK